MTDLLNYLDTHSGGLNALFSLVVATATVVYAVLTWHLVRETREMRRAQTEPHMSVAVEPSPVGINFVDLVVRNTGSGPAYDVTFACEPGFAWRPGSQIADWGLFKHGIKHIPVGHTLRYFLTDLPPRAKAIADDAPSERFTITVRYSNSARKSFTQTFPIDLKHLVGMMSLGTPPLLEIARSLTKLREDIHQLAVGFRRVKVDVHTSADRAADSARWVAEAQEDEQSAPPDPPPAA